MPRYSQCGIRTVDRLCRFQDGVVWYRNGEKISESFTDWRVQVDERGFLRIMPLFVTEDDGRYECYREAVLKGSLSLHVLSTTVSRLCLLPKHRASA